MDEHEPAAQPPRSKHLQEAEPFLRRALDDIIAPLRQWADEWNRSKPDGRRITAVLPSGSRKDNTLEFFMKFPDGSTRRLKFGVMLIENYQVVVNADPHDQWYETRFPTLWERTVRMVGSAEFDDGCGFNFLFVEKTDAASSGASMPVAIGDWLVNISHPYLMSYGDPWPDPHAEDAETRYFGNTLESRSEVRDFEPSHLRRCFDGDLPWPWPNRRGRARG